MNLDKITENKEEIFEAIYSDDFTWKGYANGDTTAKYQGRKMKQLALVLLLAGEEMSKGEPILPESQRRKLFYDFIRHLSDRPHSNSSGNSCLDLGSVANLYKLV